MPAADPEKIPIASVAQLALEVEALERALRLSETEHTWQTIDGALKRFQAVVRGGACKYEDEFLHALKSKEVVRGIVRSLSSERTRLSATTLDLLSSMTRLAGSFHSLLPHYAPPLLRLLCRTNKLYVSRATSALAVIVAKTRLAELVRYIVQEWKSEGGKSVTFRLGAVETVLVMLGAAISLQKHAEELEWMLKTAATDREAKVREAVKKVWDAYKREFPDRVEGFTAPLTPTTRRYLAIPAKDKADKPSGLRRPAVKAASTASPRPPSRIAAPSRLASAPRAIPEPRLMRAKSHGALRTAATTAPPPPMPTTTTATTSRLPPTSLRPPAKLSASASRAPALSASVGAPREAPAGRFAPSRFRPHAAAPSPAPSAPAHDATDHFRRAGRAVAPPRPELATSRSGSDLGRSISDATPTFATFPAMSHAPVAPGPTAAVSVAPTPAGAATPGRSFRPVKPGAKTPARDEDDDATLSIDDLLRRSRREESPPVMLAPRPEDTLKPQHETPSALTPQAKASPSQETAAPAPAAEESFQAPAVQDEPTLSIDDMLRPQETKHDARDAIAACLSPPEPDTRRLTPLTETRFMHKSESADDLLEESYLVPLNDLSFAGNDAEKDEVASDGDVSRADETMGIVRDELGGDVDVWADTVRLDIATGNTPDAGFDFASEFKKLGLGGATKKTPQKREVLGEVRRNALTLDDLL